MESEEAAFPEKLVEKLTLSEEQNSSQANCNNVHYPKLAKDGMNQFSDSEAREDDDLFHDCNDSFESGLVEENHNEKADTSEDQAEPDENDLLQLEKNMSEEEKEKRRNESMKLKEEGNEQFKKGDYKEAEDSYARALQVCPAYCNTDRSILYSNRAAARMKQDKKETAISDCSKALELNPNYIKALLRRAELYEKTEKLDEALEDYKNLLEKDPSIHQAREACVRLPRQIEERNEKLKEEMLGKLKDLGNLVLRPFGLSTENFQVNQDSSTGSYSINFVQNPNNNNR
ncbi:tetratricopeptide repeat protein 1 [Sceloporus undulatus]|uniref:tetratricopeptide repeat protein 1 n=1 Tax=Sceloporus undulatus TaxID=8520 RepID=UPI001C4CF918|nr:tetratricopeptide repeat protein 1 [Sceloporus undulatus]